MLQLEMDPEVRQALEDIDLSGVKEVPLTVETLRAVMPKRQRHNITQSLVDQLNVLVIDPEERKVFRENLLGFTGILQDNATTLGHYIHAVKYVSYKLMGYTNKDSWCKTFPQRHARLIKDKKSAEFIRATVAMYNRNKIVNTIIEQTMVPIWVLNQDKIQQAINVQVSLMLSAKSEKVRTDAANSLLVHLKQPETTKLHLNVRVKEDDSIRELRDATVELVRQQRLMIQSGAMNAEEVARGKLITGDFERVK